MASAYDANPFKREEEKREEEKYGWDCIELNHFLLARVLDYHGRETGLTSDETQQRVDEAVDRITERGSNPEFLFMLGTIGSYDPMDGDKPIFVPDLLENWTHLGLFEKTGERYKLTESGRKLISGKEDFLCKWCGVGSLERIL